MTHDHRYIRDLVQLRENPRLPIMWLLLPWGAALWWSVSVARALLPAPATLKIGWAFFFTMVTGRFLVPGAFATVATWAWLYFAWPDHRRVLCWAAAGGFVGLWIRPPTAIAVVPLFVSVCMCGAIIEQAWALRRARGEHLRAAPAV